MTRSEALDKIKTMEMELSVLKSALSEPKSRKRPKRSYRAQIEKALTKSKAF